MIAYFGPCQMKRKGKDREEPSKQQSNELRKRSTQSHQAYFYLMKAQITDNWYAYPIISFSPKHIGVLKNSSDPIFHSFLSLSLIFNYDKACKTLQKYVGCKKLPINQVSTTIEVSIEQVNTNLTL